METKKTVKLGDLCKKVTYGVSTLERMDGTIPVPLIRSENITENNQVDPASIKTKKIKESAAGKVLNTGDILISLLSPEKMAIVPPEADGYSFTHEFIALEFDSSIINPQVVTAYLQLPQITDYLKQKCEMLPYMRDEMVKTIMNLEITLPSADTQKHLVELMDLAIEQKALISTEAELLTRLVRSLVARYTGGMFS